MRAAHAREPRAAALRLHNPPARPLPCAALEKKADWTGTWNARYLKLLANGHIANFASENESLQVELYEARTKLQTEKQRVKALQQQLLRDPAAAPAAS